MLLPMIGGLIVTSAADRECRLLADRHYSRRTVGARDFTYAGEKVVLRDWRGDVVFAWVKGRAEYRADGRDGVMCSIFRNESSRRSSEIIREAEAHAVRRWGPSMAFTFVDPRRVRSVNPGCCFLKAGWRREAQRTKGGLVVLIKELC